LDGRRRTIIAGLAAGWVALAILAPAAIAEDAAETRARLDAVTHEIVVTEERQNALRLEMAALDRDRASLNDALIATGERAQRLEAELDDSEKRMAALIADEGRVRASLQARRGVLAEVLAALQRIGRSPPPALVVEPQDALASVRSAILLGAVVPDMRHEAEALSSDLRSLVALHDEMNREHERLQQAGTALAEERERISLLIAEKHKARDASAQQLLDTEGRMEELATEATSLKDLIARSEREIAAAADAAAEARRADAARTSPSAGGGLGDSDRIAPAIAFGSAQGLLPQPANGVQIRAYGEDDGLGGRAQGISIATRSDASVLTPADGWVVFAGPFRSYGKLLIINAGDGYHILLAGMDRIDVDIGQFVLAGEPVAAMGARRLASASAGAAELGASQPVLYVEFRKDGNSIDPGPWWAKTNDEKVGG
jgi:septal ring factor EnvC (AmiA/AmiB activator)